MAKELVPILFSCAILGPRLAKHVVLFQCDLSLVSAILKGPRCDASTKMYVVFCGLFDIDIRPEHIAGSINCTADHLSRNNFSLNSQVSRLPVPLPPPLTLMVRSRDLDWTSLHFNELFKDITT